jgi:tetratricopeptide (TPR) repeat protein
MGPSSSRALACAAFLTATLAHSIDARAQQSCSDGPSCYEAGQALLVEGEYGKAIIQFNKGYTFDENGVFLVNIALCYAGLEKYDRAISYAQDAAKEELPKEFAVFNASNLASYIVIDSSMSSAVEVKRALENKKDEVKDPDPDPDPKPDDGGGLSALGYTGVGLGVLGLASLGGSAYFATVYGEQLERIEARDPTQSREEAEQNQQTGLLLLGVGTGATLVGVGLVAFDLLTGSDASDSKNERAATPVLTTTPDGGVYTGVHLRF